jgi:mycothiol synthase
VTTGALTRVDPSQFATWRGSVAALDGAARAVDGHGSLGDAVWRDLAHPGADSVGFALDAGAYLHLFRPDPTGTAWTAGLVRLVGFRDRAVTTILIDAAVTHVAHHGGGTLTCWILGATDVDDATFDAAAFRATRTLLEMRAPLPVPEPVRWPDGITVRTFVAPDDDTAWLALNNRAFGEHPDQGGWSAVTLHRRMDEPWFDPTLFLLAFDDVGLAGFNWLKQHPAVDPDPALGEIYVIGVDPRTQGSGLGRALAVAGLHAVHERGAAAAMLFCAANNTNALMLYRSLGFSVHRTDRAYETTIRAL